ncbi:amino acid permease [Verrucomicrobiaceae bacterium 5K15]|uniref:Amino acid permease n=1 Tax=Oceaniferula flava TaxID=2800421 RepID=A0AAE2SC21_9BACT|nr:APC family permease [Oceaniferula flavus]MBK1853735.1 amino acid permease [Oceaniferula flavus]MBM1135041.1 amino acid permease [Oceaniferula flavus]
MHKSQKPIGFWSAVSMGVGAMVGAGIFALLGEASAISGSAVYISFILGGIIALFSGYSLGKLGARYPSSGGIIEYLSQAYGVGFFTGTMGVMLYFSAVVSLSLVAKAFGNYAVTFLPSEQITSLTHHFFAIGIIVLFVGINLKGAKDVAIWERITVGVKFVVLTGLSIAGIMFVDPELLSTKHYPGSGDILFSLAITFFAFEGFRVITNTAEDMPTPSKTLPKAMMTAILLVMVLYVAIAFAVFGNLPVGKVIAAKDFALAEAALPIFGKTGFTVVAITALIATASSINANLYAVTNVTYQLAKEGELPAQFGKPIAHSREGLIISGILIIVLSLLFDLSEIASIGSISILLIHTVTHLGHLKILNETKGSKPLVLTAAILSLTAMVLALIYVSKSSNHVVYVLAGFVLLASSTEVILQKIAKREIKPRIQ